MQFGRTNLQARRALLAIRVVAGLALAVGALGFAGCSTVSVQSDLDLIVKMAPAPVMVTKGQEMRTAELAAKRITGAQAFRGVGDSMEPLYASGTAIVVTPVNFSQLRAGMTVLYVSHSGRGVAHVLTNEMPGGWIAQGLNNKDEDSDLVTAANLVGVVTQAYASTDTALRREVASRELRRAGVTQLALNLPKMGTADLAFNDVGGTR